MSNASVGNIYHQIINEVIEASRVDFEDQGVGEEVLEELRKVCSFFPPSPSSLRTSHTQAHMRTKHKAGGPVSTSSARMKALLSFISPGRHTFRASKSVSDWIAQVLPPPLQGAVGWLGCLCCLFAAALQAVAGAADCGSESEEGRAPGSQI